MSVKFYFRPSSESITGFYLDSLRNEKAFQKLSSLSCKKKIVEIANRCLCALAVAMAITYDIGFWLLMTVTVIPVCRLGRDHFINLIALAVSPIFIVLTAFGYYGQIYHFRKFNGFSKKPPPSMEDFDQWEKEYGKETMPKKLYGYKKWYNKNVVYPSTDNEPPSDFFMAKPALLEEVNFSNCPTDLKVVRQLKKIGADLNEQNVNGDTFLHRLLYKCHFYLTHNDLFEGSFLKLLEEILPDAHLKILSMFGLCPLSACLAFIDMNEVTAGKQIVLALPWDKSTKAQYERYFELACRLIAKGAILDDRFEEYREAILEAREKLARKNWEQEYFNKEAQAELTQKFGESSNPYVRILGAALIAAERYSLKKYDNLLYHVDVLIKNRTLLKEASAQWQAHIASEVNHCLLPPLVNLIGQYCP